MSGAGASAAPSGTVTLNGWQVSPAEETKLAKVVSDFEASHPNIKVDYTSITGNYQATMLAKFAARKPADVFYVDAADFADWVRQGVLQNLDSYVKASKFKTKPFYKNLLNTFKYQDHYYGFPKDWSSLGWRSTPGCSGNNPIPKTWAQLKRVASRITVPGGKPICLSADWARLMPFVYQAGGNGQWEDATTPPFRVAANYYVGLLKSGLAATTLARPARAGAARRSARRRRRLPSRATGCSRRWRPSRGVKFTTAPLPMVKKHGNLAFTVSYSMAKDSKNKPAAWELLKYLVGQAGHAAVDLAWPRAADPHGRACGPRSRRVHQVPRFGARLG